MMFNDKKFKYRMVYFVGVILAIFAANYFATNMGTKEIPYNQFLTLVQEGNVEKVVIQRDKIVIKAKEGTEFAEKALYTGNLRDPSLIEVLTNANVEFNADVPNNSPILNSILSMILPLIIFFMIGRLLFGKIDKKMGGGVMSFGKNTAKLYAENETGKTFKDVAGQEEAKESLVEIVDFLHKPERYAEIGARLPKGDRKSVV